MHVESPSTTSKISNPLNFLLLQTRPNCLGRSWNLSTKRLERRLHSGPPYLLDIIIWRLNRRETTSHLCFHSGACLYPQPSLRMPDWGLLQKKMARKNTYNAINLPDLRSFKTPSVMSVTWQFRPSPQYLNTVDNYITSPYMEELSVSDYLLAKMNWTNSTHVGFKRLSLLFTDVFREIRRVVCSTALGACQLNRKNVYFNPWCLWRLDNKYLPIHRVLYIGTPSF